MQQVDRTSRIRSAITSGAEAGASGGSGFLVSVRRPDLGEFGQ